MKIRELTQAWEKTAKGRVTRDSYAVHLTLEDAARLEALLSDISRLRLDHPAFFQGWAHDVARTRR